jgi:hypothetical protein
MAGRWLVSDEATAPTSDGKEEGRRKKEEGRREKGEGRTDIE